MRHGGRAVFEQLRANRVELVFQVPGESFLPLLDAFADGDGPRLVTGRQEGGVSMMAEAYGKLTGRPGIALVTRGPGAANACAGVHVARQDETPMVLLVGDVERAQRHRDAFQEVDQERWFQPLAKAAFRVECPDRLPEYVHRALHLASSGRAGPVVLALPEDVLAAPCPTPTLAPVRSAELVPSAEQVAELAGRIAAATRPVVIVGGGAWSQAAARALAAWAEAWELPVVAAFRCQDYLDNRHPCYVGDLNLAPDPELVQAVRDADVVLVVGSRIDEITAGGFAILEAPAPRQRLLHAHPDPDVPGGVLQAEYPLAAHPAPLLARLAATEPPAARPWSARTRALRERWLRWSGRPDPAPGRIHPGEVVRWLCEQLGERALLCHGAGNFSGWIHRYFRFSGYRSQLAPRSGSMGYALPAAIAAKLLHPEREVICWSGDGDFQMTLQEFGTACANGLAVRVVLLDNGMYGTIRMHQERRFPDRVVGTELVNPDFAAWARAYGAYGARVASGDEFRDAFREAQRSDGPALLHLLIDPEAITTRESLSAIREAGRGRRREQEAASSHPDRAGAGAADPEAGP